MTDAAAGQRDTRQMRLCKYVRRSAFKSVATRHQVADTRPNGKKSESDRPSIGYVHEVGVGVGDDSLKMSIDSVGG